MTPAIPFIYAHGAKGTLVKIKTGSKVGVALSGGIDSAVASLILKNEGFDVLAITMSIHGDDSDPAVEQAVKTSDEIGLQHVVLDMSREFKDLIISPFIEAYLRGTTPNPCILCNREIKFGTLLNYALKAGCRYFATGHYARIGKGEDGRLNVTRGVDGKKDQSYMLWTLGRNTLDRILLPLGGLTKKEVRRIAAENCLGGFVPESQDICFLPENDYHTFIRKSAESRIEPGPIYDVSGNRIGTHKGIAFYTIGQRKGLGLGHHKAVYVTRIDPAENSITVGAGSDLKRESFNVSSLNFIDGAPPGERFSCQVETRYRGPLVEAEVEVTGQDGGTVRYRKPGQWGAPGQSAVFYRGDTLIGGGVIVPRD